jgi:hypothetical protein
MAGRLSIYTDEALAFPMQNDLLRGFFADRLGGINDDVGPAGAS